LKHKKKIEWALGFFFGLLTPIFGIAIFMQIYPVLATVTEWRDPSWQLILIRLGTFGVMMNVAVFFLALKFDKEKIAMGILWVCVLYLALLGVMQFIS
jgi:hypothetical protein